MAESVLPYVGTLKLHFTLWSLSHGHWEDIILFLPSILGRVQGENNTLCQIQCDFTGAEINTFECVYWKLQ